MTVEIIALVEKNYGQKVLEEMKSSPGVLQILNVLVGPVIFLKISSLCPGSDRNNCCWWQTKR